MWELGPSFVVLLACAALLGAARAGPLSLDDALREAHAAAARYRIAERDLEVDVKSQFAECLIARRSFACDV